MLSIQIIMIIGSEDRKRRQIQQLKDLQIPFPVYFLEASTPENSASYLPVNNDTPKEKRILCCARSHIRAIEHASRDTSPDLSIILEDDAALHKNQFVPLILNFAAHWDTLVPERAHMVSLGWVPQKTYTEYDDAVCNIQQPDVKILEWFAFGTQAYLIKKSSAKKFTPILYKDTWLQVKASVHANRTINIKEDNPIRDADHWLNRYLLQVLAFPMSVIEQKIPSTLTNNSDGNAWNYSHYFKHHPHSQKEFWSFDTTNL